MQLSRRWRALVLTPTLAVCAIGCGPLLSAEDFLRAANEIAFSPDLTCDELKAAFGMPHVPTVATPDQIGMDFEEARVTTTDGETLRVWRIPARADRGTILLSMGAVGDMSCYLFVVYMLRANGWTVVLYDYRGFGDSSGQPDLDGLNADLTAVLDWTVARDEVEDVVLMGISVGSIPSATIAVQRPDDVSAVIIDGPIAVSAEVPRFGFLIANQIERFVELFDDSLQLGAQAPLISQPLLVFLYGQDEFLTSAAFEGLLADSGVDLTAHWFPNLPHARGPYLKTAEYFVTVERFLTKLD